MAPQFPENGGRRSSETSVVLHKNGRRRIPEMSVTVVSSSDHRCNLDGVKGVLMSPSIYFLPKNRFFGGGGLQS